MREGRIRPSLSPFPHRPPPPGRAAMREGRIRPSLQGRRQERHRPVYGRNEGGANSPLVVGEHRFEAGGHPCRNEGGANSPLVGGGPASGLFARMRAAMREGRIRPSLAIRTLRPPPPNCAAMREGRIRPSLEYSGGGVADSMGCRNEGGANSPLVEDPPRREAEMANVPQ